MYQVPDQTGRRVVITGANSGTGKEAAKRLGADGAHVIMAVRTPGKGEQAKAEILADHPYASLEIRRLDLADLVSVRDFADQLVTVATRRGWQLASIAAHLGYTRTNLQTAGASLGRDKPRRAPGTGLPLLPSQAVEQGTEPMRYAATSPDAV